MNKMEERARKAKERVDFMEKNFISSLVDSIKNAKIYDAEIPLDTFISNKDMKVSVVPMGTSEAIIKNNKPHMAALNFASYTTPGGGFLAGAMAQEEALCHDSNLYNVLSKFPEFYKENKADLNNELYTNKALYTPGVVFESEGKIATCDIITCASPNKTAALLKGAKVSENSKALSDRIKFILQIAAMNKVKTLILGAWGCGVFGQDPREVATLFKKHLINFRGFSEVIFAIPKGNGNYEVFKDVFKEDKA